MKNFLLMIMIFVTFSLVCYSQEFISTAQGGDWNNPETWTNGKIPDANSDVVISGSVSIHQPIQCKNLKISKNGIIEFTETQDSLTSKISEILTIDDGKIIIHDKWNIFAKEIKRLNEGKIENFGIINVGM